MRSDHLYQFIECDHVTDVIGGVMYARALGPIHGLPKGKALRTPSGCDRECDLCGTHRSQIGVRWSHSGLVR